MSDSRTYDATDLLRTACRRHGIDLAVLVAETALWAHPEVHRRLMMENGTGAFFPGQRRARSGSGESRGTLVDGVRLDDNGAANQTIKKAIGLKPEHVRGFEACHLWPRTAYDERCHTVVANLVLLPRALAGMSDHDPEILAVLQFRSFELYGWHPQGMDAPERPTGYPSCWRDPEPFTPEVALILARRFANSTRQPGDRPMRWEEDDVAARPSTSATMHVAQTDAMPLDERHKVIERIQLWARKPDSNVHRIIALVARSPVRLQRRQLERLIETSIGSANGRGAVASLLTSKANSYGRALIDRDGFIEIHPDVADEVQLHAWT